MSARRLEVSLDEQTEKLRSIDGRKSYVQVPSNYTTTETDKPVTNRAAYTMVYTKK